jgi:4-oxalocrotonate tautomerase
MPTVRIELNIGRTLDQKRALVRLVTEAVVAALNVSPDKVHVKLYELEKHNIARAGILYSDINEQTISSGQD